MISYHVAHRLLTIRSKLSKIDDYTLYICEEEQCYFYECKCDDI